MYAVWGGLRELAQALWKVKETRTPEQVAEFTGKLLVHDINDQDGHRAWITGNFPAIRFIANGLTRQVPSGAFGIGNLPGNVHDR
jgi:hypothetical protein